MGSFRIQCSVFGHGIGSIPSPVVGDFITKSQASHCELVRRAKVVALCNGDEPNLQIQPNVLFSMPSLTGRSRACGTSCSASSSYAATRNPLGLDAAETRESRRATRREGLGTLSSLASASTSCNSRLRCHAKTGAQPAA